MNFLKYPPKCVSTASECKTKESMELHIFPGKHCTVIKTTLLKLAEWLWNKQGKLECPNLDAHPTLISLTPRLFHVFGLPCPYRLCAYGANPISTACVNSQFLDWQRIHTMF